MKKGFDSKKYLQEQTKFILERIEATGSERLYLEFGGKLVEDRHAARVLPGYDENAKIKVLKTLKDQAEIIICVYSGDITTSKARHDFHITYDLEVMRLIDVFRSNGLSINSVVITRYQESPNTIAFIRKLQQRDIKVYKHTATKGYPRDVDIIVSDEGYGANEMIETTRPLVVVTGPGGGSGKLATCLSQLYHENLRGTKASYAKFETFPIWNLPVKHPVNIAYEAATIDLQDVVMVDPFHLEKYNEMATNYNRDIEVFPIVNRIIEKITGEESIYKSPTDMGVNRAGFSITDEEVVKQAAQQEVIRRYLIANIYYKKGMILESVLDRSKLLLDEMGIMVEDRAVVLRAHEKLQEKRKIIGENKALAISCIELPDGKIIYGKSSRKMVASAAAILNAIKYLSNIDDEVHIIAPEFLESIQNLKLNVLNRRSEVLECEEILNALAVSAVNSECARLAEESLKQLKGCKLHCTAISLPNDDKTLAQLGLDVTCDPVYEGTNLYYR